MRKVAQSVNQEDFKKLTIRQSRKGRNSNLGNTLCSIQPRQLLKSLHEKTHFKACKMMSLNVK